MSSRRAISVPANFAEKPPKKRGRCTNCLCITWKIFTCILSHTILIAVVIAYCWLGALLFEYLEKQNEIETKESIADVRNKLTKKLRNLTNQNDYLNEEEWISNATEHLRDFESQILKKIKADGWDGDEDITKLRWTFPGALFYSIIVITTIGYGHISPKTPTGKIVTIFYAIVGIPLMLLCLSTIGDILATFFRFIYWRICCFVCTRDPRRRRHRRKPGFQRSASHSGKFGNRSSVRRSVRMSQRINDPIADTYCEPNLPQTYSDPDLRHAGTELNHVRPTNPRSQRFHRHRHRGRVYQERHTLERDRSIDRYAPRYEVSKTRTNSQKSRSRSVARERETARPATLNAVSSKNYAMTLPASYGRHRSRHRVLEQDVVSEVRAKSVDPQLYYSKDILCNPYAIDKLDREIERAHRYSRARSMPRQHHRYSDIYTPIREVSQTRKYPSHEVMPRQRDEYELPSKRFHRGNGMSRYLEPPPMEDECIEEKPETPIKKVKRREKAPLPPSPRIMSPMGFPVRRQARLQQYDEESAVGDEMTDRSSDMPTQIRPVPIWLCVFLVIGYIIAGAFLFDQWEHWGFLNSAYFCFITLTTIGFGDYVPAQDASQNQTAPIAYCSLYLLFGIALLAMSFNLVQEEVIANVKDIARQIGILKEEESDY